ncbi:MAG TPA: hypothetical protein VGW34_04545 [Allosphingosinicella sp.]|nr:hypothetical protein [Allosphingosinicella sp.]
MPTLTEPPAPGLDGAAEPTADPHWLAWAAAGGAALLALLGLAMLRRRRRIDAGTDVPARKPLEADTAARPAPAPVPEAPRPRLDIDFLPDRVVLTPDKAEIHYRLAVRNVGEAAAENVRIAVRMVNAGADGEAQLAEFFAERDLPPASVPPWLMPAGHKDQLGGVAVLANSDIRGFELQGRRLFVPVVAFNVLYDGGGAGGRQMSASYVVGREAEPPAEKMGAFRLDLGPRVYRQVGRRANLPPPEPKRKRVRVRIEA